ncbi:MAG: replicative DNA helicase [Phycisphaerae bacterium]|nr:replicative DNA helicase [Phycisphaerae bacterium]
MSQYEPNPASATGGNGRREERSGRRPAARESFSKLYERPLPYSLEAEMALLGALIIGPEVAPDVIGVVSSADDFHDAGHAAIYQALIETYDKDPKADLVAIQEVLRGRDQLERVGGADYLTKLAAETPSAAGALRYARIVADKARLRRLIDAADQIIYDALNVSQIDGAREVIDAAERVVFEIAQEDQKADPQSLARLLDLELERLASADGRLTGLPTGYPDLDRILSGLQPGEMIIVAARPSMGKTALALNLAEQIARGGRSPGDAPKGPPAPVGIFSLEMSKAALVQRLLSAFANIDGHRLRTGHLSAIEMASLQTHAEGLAETPLFIDDTPGLTVLSLRARARRMVAQHGVRAVFIDYLQLLSAPGSARESRQVEVSAISRGIKALARELSVPVVCLSQLNRASEQREGNRPRMSDLRESGSIEQDADVVVLLHREDYYHQGNDEWAANNPDKIGVAELIVAKQRNGPTGTVRLTWDNRTTRFKSHSSASGGYDSFESPFAAPFDAEPKPPPRSGYPSPGGFPAGGRTGPVENFRDGGGPDADDDLPI